MDELRQREWFSLFDGGVASCDVHLCSPEPAIYTTLMQTCNLAYDESIFIDDNKVNAPGRLQPGHHRHPVQEPQVFLNVALRACGIEA